ncbi:hypothetical protein SNOG_02742 [Parastagonospora nodorum SN15]|uniref:Uncharacterized protein n=1 Tax=Phaeosphaeria nodorum (strain SN15 / ATCC MYA-4574 / FGSC 10173) TaxID=321614 RepID=Q0UZS2_PHANO|nr:hypothetical protein SNOG_02742 [Parastagonospora nodorum SN15]EAT89473.1 hypothetical protein SNOG_02742 [Parastagonospora nodorum SN15]
MAVAHRSFGNCPTVETSAPVKTADSASVLSTWKCSLQSGRSSEQLHHSPCSQVRVEMALAINAASVRHGPRVPCRMKSRLLYCKGKYYGAPDLAIRPTPDYEL